jgi:hypothetical protein
MIRSTRLAPGPVAAASLTQPGAPCAIAVFVIAAEAPADLDRWLERTGLGAIACGACRLVRAFGVDQAVLARPAQRVAHLMPHGGPAAIAAIERALRDAGAEAVPPGALDPAALCPAATTPKQALAMALLSMAASPLAVDVLALQGAMPEARSEPAPSASLDPQPLVRLLVPPTVAVVGAANIGKSTLLNALARREAAIVADEPGTTRDHLGVGLALDGLAVRWLDTPGLRPLDPARSAADAIEAESHQLAARAIAGADLLVLAADAGHEFPQPPVPLGPGSPPDRPAIPVVRVWLRCDRPPQPSPPPQPLSSPVSPGPTSDAGPLRVAIPPGQAPPAGLDALARAIRAALVPDAWLAEACVRPLPLAAVAERVGFARRPVSR